MAHISEMAPYSGVLSRNGTYRDDAYNPLLGSGVYTNVPDIAEGLEKIKTFGNFPKHPPASTMTSAQIKADAVARAPGYVLCRSAAGTPNLHYNYQAHHILPVEIFYDDKWQAYIKPGKGIRTYLRQVKLSNYDINNEDNIIYLPQINSLPQNAHICEIHRLPDHSKGHVPNYNDQVVTQAQDVYDMIEEAADKSGCDAKKVRDQIYDRLKELEEDYYDYLIKRGKAGTRNNAPGSMGAPSMA